MKPEYNQLLQQFKDIRKAIGFSQTRIAKYVDVTQHTISRTESKKTIPRMDIFLEMVKGMGYSLVLVPLTGESAKIIEKVVIKEAKPEEIDWNDHKQAEALLKKRMEE